MPGTRRKQSLARLKPCFTAEQYSLNTDPEVTSVVDDTISPPNTSALKSISTRMPALCGENYIKAVRCAFCVVYVLL